MRTQLRQAVVVCLRPHPLLQGPQELLPSSTPVDHERLRGVVLSAKGPESTTSSAGDTAT